MDLLLQLRGRQRSPEIILIKIDDQVVLIGASFQESRDFFATPNGLMSGLEIHANIIHTLLTRSHIRPANRILAMFLLLLFAVAASALTTLLRPATVIVLSLVAIPVVLLPLSYAALTQLGLWVDFATPLLVTSWGALATEYCDSRQIRNLLANMSDGKSPSRSSIRMKICKERVVTSRYFLPMSGTTRRSAKARHRIRSRH